MFLETSRIQLIYQYIHALNLWLEYSLNTFCDSSIFVYVYDLLNMCFMYMCYSSVMCMNGTMSFCVRYFSHALGLFHDLASSLLYFTCAFTCLDLIVPWYNELIVCIICIHMITIGNPYKRHEVLARTRCPVSQVRNSWLEHEVRITK